MNSGPSSDRICLGTPRRLDRPESTSITSSALSLRATRMASHSRVTSSMTFSNHITVSRSWLAAHKRIGDGTGVLDNRFRLDDRLFLDAGERKIWEAKLVRSGRGFRAVVQTASLSCYGRDATVHKDLKKALAAPPPASFRSVDAAPIDEDEAFLAELVAEGHHPPRIDRMPMGSSGTPKTIRSRT